MNKNLRWKVVTVLVVFIVFFTMGVYPILARQFNLPAPAWVADLHLRLGLDLQGGVHLVLRVQTDDALDLSTTTVSEQIREQLRTANIPVTSLTVTSPTTFRVEGVPPEKDAEFRRISDEHAAASFERNDRAGGIYEFTMRPNVAKDLREQAVVQAQDTIERRVNELGVSEPNIARYGEQNDQLLVQMPGETDVARAKSIIRSTSMLELKLVEAGPAGSQEALLQPFGGTVPDGMEVVPGAETGSFYLLRKVAAVTGQDLRSAKQSLDENNRPAVDFTLNPEGAKKFGRITGDNIGRSLAIVLDGKVQSAPRIDGRISDQGKIYGSFTADQVRDLSITLRSGALPASLTYLEERVIGPTLGADSIRSGIVASLAGLVMVVVFMLVYYRLSGVNAVVALLMNLIILLGMMAYFGATMTLPGIAGFVLTMGMGVDSNVLIFERIKEELEAQRGVRGAINAGFSRVFWTLLDTHVASLISAMFLFQFGTGAIRGFATTLTLGLLANLFTSIFVSKTLFEVELSRNPQRTTLSI